MINEQQILTPRRLRKDGYVALPQPPSDFQSGGYIVKIAQGKKYYKRKDNQPIEVRQGPDLTQYDGKYKTGSIVGDIYVDGQNLKGAIGVINAPLVFLQGETFSVTTSNFGSGTITFVKDDSGKVTGFTYKVGSYTGTADKIDGGNNSSTNTPAPPASQPAKPATNPQPQQPQKPVNVIDYKIKYPSAQDTTKPFIWRPCDENSYNWDYGCKNNKIGQMNKILFKDRYGDIYGDELLSELRNYRYLDKNETKITEDIYNMVIKLGKEQGNVYLQEMIVKQTVKNILKERLNKK